MGNKRWSRAAAVGLPPVATWATVATELLEPAVREKFEAKHKAVFLYLSGVPTQEIFEQTGIQRWDLPRMVKRCMDLATDGRILGFRGLLPYLRVTGYTRKKVVESKRPQQKGGHTGALGAVLTRFPGIEAELIALLKKERKGKRIHEHKIRGTTLHRMFQDCLRERGVTETEWPFNTSYLGIRSIQRFMKELLDANFDRSVNTREEKPAKAHLAVGRGIEPLLLFEEPFDAVELDAYSINAFFSVLFETPEGTQTSVQLDRLWLLALIDRAGSAALAYSIVYSSEVSADDVIKVIRDAVSKKWQPMELTIKGLRYPKDGGLPSGVIPECFGATWGCLLLDGALAHLAKSVRETARRTLGFAINWGPVGHFERRPNVERLFKSISDEVFLRLPSTTGSNPGNGRAEKAQENAIRYNIHAHEVEELLDVFFAQFNATPTAGLSYLSPLEFIRHFTDSDNHHFLVRNLPTATIAASTPFPCREERTVRGGRRNGRRPYIQIDQVRYTSYLLGQTSTLVGKNLVVEIDEDDMRQVKAYLPNGAELGFLKAAGRWSLTKHSRKTRRAINRLVHRRILVLSEFDDPVQAYLRHLSLPTKKVGSEPPVPPPSKAVEAVRVSRESDLPLAITPPLPSIPQPTRGSTDSLMDELPLDLNQLINRQR